MLPTVEKTCDPASNIEAFENLNKQLESDKDGLAGKVRTLVEELEGARYAKSNAEADARLQEELL